MFSFSRSVARRETPAPRTDASSTDGHPAASPDRGTASKSSVILGFRVSRLWPLPARPVERASMGALRRQRASEGLTRRREPRAVRRARRGHQELRPRAPLGVRLPAPRRIRQRPAEDIDRQDPPHRTTRVRARSRSSCLATRSGADSRRPRPLEQLFAAAPLLEADDHRVWSDQGLDARVGETCVGHPANAVCGRVVEALLGFDEHVEAHQEPEGVL